MNGAFYIGATGLRAQERALDTVANNIANVNTNGFKRAQARFSELVTTASDPTDDTAAPGDATAGLSGVMVNSQRDFAQGPLQQTGKALDVAISGDGFLELMGPSGQLLLSRGGSLQVNSDGYLADANGLPLKAMISVPSNLSAIVINQDGRVQGQTSDSKVSELGQIDVVTVKDPTTLTPLDGGLFRPVSTNDLISAAPGDEGAGVLVQGSVETSNVDLATEMVTLLLMQRAFSANAQVVQAGDQLMSIANDLRR